MTQVHPNSIASYHGIDLTERQADVVRALKKLGKATDLGIAAYLKIEINRVTGRITELREKRVVVECDATIGRFGKSVRVCRLTEDKESLW